jgi:16S rRNA (cytidine1402-2'-O)-methyltransferase
LVIESGKKQLYIVPTPIGNMQDITLRALKVLAEVDFIIAEDTRYSQKLLNHYHIKKKTVSYYKHKEKEKTISIMKLFSEHHSAALITDCGTPLISDPGFYLVQAAIESGIDIIPLPGASACVTAMAASGIADDPFLFLGFPPRKKNQLQSFLIGLQNLPYTLIFYESPKRTYDFLTMAAFIFGSRQFAIAKELSKKHEKIIRGNLSEISSILDQEIIQGEIAIIIAGCPKVPLKSQPAKTDIQNRQDLFDYLKKQLGLSKNAIKDILMKRDE